MSLPIHKHTDTILDALQTQNRILLNAPTGSGKSTGIPPILYERNAIEGRILVVQPRRLAARLLAQRVAQTLGVKLGQEVGYSVRFEAQYTKTTKILFLTDGVLLRQLNENPQLHGIGLIIFDEFHERRIASDVALGYCRDLQSEQRPDLKLLVMSATLAKESLEQYLSPCAKINAEGRSYPVETLQRTTRQIKNPRTGRPETPAIWEQVKSLSKEVVAEDEAGNWLIFMPGIHEIRKTIDALESAAWLRDYEIYPLYSSLPPKAQMEAIESPKPKIIVSTNVAETSLTIDGVRTVIDSGLARESRYDATRDMDSLLVTKISDASATQRAGRAGRTAPGKCYRLWSESDHAKRATFQAPEVQSVDLSPTLLLLSSLGYANQAEFPWLDAPHVDSVMRAEGMLQSLGAFESDGSLTVIGKTLSSLPLPPRLARLILAGDELNCLPEAVFVAALLQGEPIVKRSSGISHTQVGHRRPKSRNPLSDFEDRLDPSSFAGLFAAYHFARANGFSPQAVKPFGLSLRALREIDKTIKQLHQQLPRHTSGERLFADPDFHSRAPLFAQATALTFPDRLCTRLGAGTLSSRLLGNRKGKLEDSTCARQGELYFATQIQEIQGRDVLTHLSGLVQVEADDIKAWFPERVMTRQEVLLDEVTNKIVSQESQVYTLGGVELQIASRISNEPPNKDLAAALLAGMIHQGKIPLPNWDTKVEQWVARLNQLADWMPELELPKITSDDRLTLLEELCQGTTRIKEVKQLDPWKTLRQWLSKLQADTLNSYAPTEITLTNGTRAKIIYSEGEPPTIAVKLQRLYDVKLTPTLCNGLIPLRVQILAPNQRPWQITSDLPNFWANGYAQMKKDLAGRYPKHEWR